MSASPRVEQPPPTRDPTPEQRTAVDCRSPRILLEAGAGTGKTGVLVDRYCDLVEEGADPDAILAFTFTDRAAAQLRDRVRRELERRAGGADPDAADRLARVARDFGGAWITTIHGFCRRLLAAHPVAAGIDPAFRVLDAAEAQRAARRAFDAALEKFLAVPEPERESTVAAYGIRGLRDIVVEAHAELRSRGEAAPRLPPPPRSDLAEALGELERCAAAAIADSGGSGEQRRKIERALELAGARAVRMPSVEQLSALTFDARGGSRAQCAAALRRAIGLAAEREGGGTVYAHLAELLQGFDRRFAEVKAERSGLDFEDLQLQAVGLLQTSAAVRAIYSERFAHLLVDEFQDTNELQLALIEALQGPATAVFLVGDEFQSIYGFRHADVEVFRGERRRLATEPEAEVLQLSGNFRSRPEVIGAANRLGTMLLPGFRPLALGSQAQAAGEPRGGRPGVELLLTEPEGWDELDLELAVDDRTAPRHVAEARFLAARLRQLADAGVPRGEMVVLLRAFTRVDAYEEALDRAGLNPYVVGGRGYWSQQQVADLLCLLGVIANPLDDETVLGALSSPASGVSPDTLWLLRRASGKRRHLWPAIEHLAGRRRTEPAEPAWLDNVPDQDREAIETFCALVAELRNAGARLSLEELVERIAGESGYDLAVLMRRPGRMRIANVRKLMRMARVFEASEGRDLRGFVEFTTLRSELDDEALAATEAEERDGVRVMTIHNAKGLEFPVVAVPDLDRDLLVGGYPPALRLAPADVGGLRVGLRMSRFGTASVPLYEMEELAEERRRLDAEEALRLFYVAATRAQERLILSGVSPKRLNGELKPSTPVINRIVFGLDLLPATDGAATALSAPAPREGLKVELDGVEMVVRVNSPSPEQATELVRTDAGEEPPEPLGEGPPPLAPGPAPAIPLRPLSYSALEEHRRCGYRFYVERVLGLGPQPAAGNGAGEAGRAERLRFGSAVHALLEWSGRRRWIEPSPNLASRLLAAEGLRPTAEMAAAAVGLVRDWTESPLCAELGAWRTRLRTEPALLLRLGEAVVRGSIDLLAEPADAPPLVIDYKTDRLDGSSPAQLAERYATQRELYALAAAEATGAEQVRVAFVFLERPGEPAVVELGAPELVEARGELEQRAAAIAAGSFEVTSEPDWPLCQDCPARRRLCPSPASP